jgi:hypothetical protein
MTRFRLVPKVLLGAVAVAALSTGALAETKKVSGAEQRKEVSITVYNQNFGLVREVRELDVGTGTVTRFRDVA